MYHRITHDVTAERCGRQSIYMNYDNTWQFILVAVMALVDDGSRLSNLQVINTWTNILRRDDDDDDAGHDPHTVINKIRTRSEVKRSKGSQLIKTFNTSKTAVSGVDRVGEFNVTSSTLFNDRKNLRIQRARKGPAERFEYPCVLLVVTNRFVSVYTCRHKRILGVWDGGFVRGSSPLGYFGTVGFSTYLGLKKLQTPKF